MYKLRDKILNDETNTIIICKKNFVENIVVFFLSIKNIIINIYMYVSRNYLRLIIIIDFLIIS